GRRAAVRGRGDGEGSARARHRADPGVRQFPRRARRRMTTMSGAPTAVDFLVLADRFRILPTSRSWSAVQESIGRLQSVKTAEWQQPAYRDDRLNVESFAKTLRDHAELIAKSLACAISLARFAKTTLSATERMNRSLEALSFAYAFTQLAPD